MPRQTLIFLLVARLCSDPLVSQKKKTPRVLPEKKTIAPSKGWGDFDRETKKKGDGSRHFVSISTRLGTALHAAIR